jgi:hypothetical protein
VKQVGRAGKVAGAEGGMRIFTKNGQIRRAKKIIAFADFFRRGGSD